MSFPLRCNVSLHFWYTVLDLFNDYKNNMQSLTRGYLLDNFLTKEVAALEKNHAVLHMKP